MRDRELYTKILGISAPWYFTDVVLDVSAGTVDVFVEHRGQAGCRSAPSPARATTRGAAAGGTSTPASSRPS
jgi:hypothetical protein